MTQLVLASSSPRRRALLEVAGRPPDVVLAADVDESRHAGEHGAALVARLSAAKRDAVLAGRRCALADTSVVLAADTVVALDGEVLGKPRDDDDARRTLRALSGRTAIVHSGVAVGGRGLQGRDPTVALVETSVRFRDLATDEVERYVATGEPRGAAGAFRLQGGGADLVAGVDGCPSNVVGLPVCATARLLVPAGIALDRRCAALVAALRAG